VGDVAAFFRLLDDKQDLSHGQGSGVRREAERWCDSI
jgi:hypothetical protein